MSEYHKTKGYNNCILLKLQGKDVFKGSESGQQTL